MNTNSVPRDTPARRRTVGGGSPFQEREHSSERLAARLGEVVVQARQFERAAHLIADDLGAHATTTHEQPVVDERLDGSPDRGARHLPAFGEVEFVVEERSLGQHAGTNGVLELAAQLVIERHWADPAEDDVEVGHAEQRRRSTIGFVDMS